MLLRSRVAYEKMVNDNDVLKGVVKSMEEQSKSIKSRRDLLNNSKTYKDKIKEVLDNTVISDIVDEYMKKQYEEECVNFDKPDKYINDENVGEIKIKIGNNEYSLKKPININCGNNEHNADTSEKRAKIFQDAKNALEEAFDKEVN